MDGIERYFTKLSDGKYPYSQLFLRDLLLFSWFIPVNFLYPMCKNIGIPELILEWIIMVYLLTILYSMWQRIRMSALWKIIIVRLLLLPAIVVVIGLLMDHTRVMVTHNVSYWYRQPISPKR
jgi:hypothetical protein